MRLGTALSLELLASRAVTADDDPWPVVNAILRGTRSPPQAAYNDDAAQIKAYGDYLKRRPAGDENADGLRTATWQVTDGAGLSMHYYFGGTAATASVFSLSVVKK